MLVLGWGNPCTHRPSSQPSGAPSRPQKGRVGAPRGGLSRHKVAVRVGKVDDIMA